MSDAYYRNPYASSASAARWNPKGMRMIYAASSPSVALLEYLCIKGNAVATRQWHMVVYEIRDETFVGTIDKSTLPRDWNVLPHGRTTQEFGRDWLNEKEYPFLKVPSARIDIAFYPLEFNMLINPDFPDLSNLIKVAESIPFTYLLNPSKAFR
jgi:RES domain-containing protein